MPSPTPTYRCFCKAVKGISGSPTYSSRWALSKRAWFQIHGNHILCGGWNIPFADITSATRFRTKQWFIPVSILQIITPDCSYQFGFNPWANPWPHLRVPLGEEHVKLGYSRASMAIRVGLVGLALFYLFDKS